MAYMVREVYDERVSCLRLFLIHREHSPILKLLQYPTALQTAREGKTIDKYMKIDGKVPILYPLNEVSLTKETNKVT